MKSTKVAGRLGMDAYKAYNSTLSGFCVLSHRSGHEAQLVIDLICIQQALTGIGIAHSIHQTVRQRPLFVHISFC